MVSITKNSSELAKFIICVATFLGTYIPSKFMHKMDNRRDKLYIFDITADNLISGKLFAKEIRDRDFAIRSDEAHDSDMNEVLCCKIYCETKDQSRIVKQLIPKEFKYNVYLPIETDD
jgi:hypothetical protein